MRLHRTHARPGFTLIELLVVIALMLLLVGITVSVSYSGLIDGYKTVGAGDRASGWLLIAKSKAQREGAPRGVRFIRDTTNPNLIKEAQYIEVPDPYVIRRSAVNDTVRIQLTDNGMGGHTATILGLDAAGIADLQSNVFAGDSLSLPEYGVLLNIGSPPFTVSGTSVAINVNPALLPQLGSATQTTTVTFGFLRQARPSLGEPILLLTGDNAIDYALCSSQVDLNLLENTVDVLFAPNGEVLYTTKGKTILWVRNTSQPYSGFDTSGQMSLVVIYTKTGAIATQPVTRGADPFAATKDGFNTGL